MDIEATHSTVVKWYQQDCFLSGLLFRGLLNLSLVFVGLLSWLALLHCFLVPRLVIGVSDLVPGLSLVTVLLFSLCLPSS